eukprot:14184169-Alexandrium_andersonii.AAC.1
MAPPLLLRSTLTGCCLQLEPAGGTAPPLSASAPRAGTRGNEIAWHGPRFVFSQSLAKPRARVSDLEGRPLEGFAPMASAW